MILSFVCKAIQFNEYCNDSLAVSIYVYYGFVRKWIDLAGRISKDSANIFRLHPLGEKCRLFELRCVEMVYLSAALKL